MLMMKNHRSGRGGNWLLHLAGIAGVFVLGREAGKHLRLHSNFGSSWNPSSTTDETVSTPESGHQ
ncbi:MAG: hypothetical protein WA131_11400 [Desulfitobacteriaceae bacterium]